MNMISQTDPDFERVKAKWGKTHIIQKVMGTKAELKELNPKQSVCWGDGETYHFLLTEKPPMKTVAEMEALSPEEQLSTLKLAKGGTWYDGWRPYCIMCSYSGRIQQMPYGFKCPTCRNMIGWDLTRLQESPLNDK